MQHLLKELALGFAPSQPEVPVACPGAGERRGMGGPPPDLLWLLFSASWELQKSKRKHKFSVRRSRDQCQ
jgi:hypothetical protein